MKCKNCGLEVVKLVGNMFVDSPSEVHEIEMYLCDCRVLFHDKTAKLAFDAVIKEKRKL